MRAAFQRDRTAIYTLSSTRGYLIEALAPFARVCIAHTDDTAADALASLPSESTRFVFHLDLTMTGLLPRDRIRLTAALSARGITPFNQHVTDISKRTVQQHCRTAGARTMCLDKLGSADALVIIKSNLNAFGAREKQLTQNERCKLGISAGDLSLPLKSYAVMPRSRVPPAWWSHQGLVIERFVQNPAGRFYRVYVVGNRVVVSESAVSSPLKKMGRGLPRHSFCYVDDAPAADNVGGHDDRIAEVYSQARLLFEAFRLDFGALDLVEDVSGCTYVCDVNSTPYWGENEPAMVAFLAPGLHAVPR